MRILGTKDLQDSWDHHVSKWRNCVRCDLGHYCVRHVLGRGSIPCDILFIDNHPSREDEMSKQPLSGRNPHGILLNRLIDRVEWKHDFTYAITDLTACVPRDSYELDARLPKQDEINTCRDRLIDLVLLAKPKGIVLLGVAVEAQWQYLCGFERYELFRTAPYHRIPSFEFLIQHGGSDPKNRYWADAIKYLRLFVKEVTETTHGSSEDRGRKNRTTS